MWMFTVLTICLAVAQNCPSFAVRSTDRCIAYSILVMRGLFAFHGLPDCIQHFGHDLNQIFFLHQLLLMILSLFFFYYYPSSCTRKIVFCGKHLYFLLSLCFVISFFPCVSSHRYILLRLSYLVNLTSTCSLIPTELCLLSTVHGPLYRIQHFDQ